MFAEDVEDLLGYDVEEFASQVHTIHSLVGELAVEHGLDSDGVLGEEQGMDVETAWHGRVAELADTVHRF